MRWVALLGVLGVTLYLTWNAPQIKEDAIVSAPLRTPGANSGHLAGVQQAEVQPVVGWRDLLKTPRHWHEEDVGADPFMVRLSGASRAAAKDGTPPPPPPPAPEAPALPFKFMGGFNRGGDDWAVYLLNGDMLHTVKPGDVIEGKYHVDKIGGGVIAFTYLPLNIQQELIIGGTQ
jgi:hypothetical protein